MATVSLSQELKNAMRVKVLDHMSNTVQQHINKPVRGEFPTLEEVMEHHFPHQILEAADLLMSKVADNMHAGSHLYVQWKAEPYDGDGNEVFGKFRSQYALRRYNHNRALWTPNPLNLQNGVRKIIRFEDANKESPLLGRPPVVYLKKEWPITYKFQRRLYREKVFHDKIGILDGFVYDFLEARSTLGQCQRDWPELLHHTGNTDKVVKLGKTKARGKQTLTDDDRAMIEEINTTVALGMILPKALKKDYLIF